VIGGLAFLHALGKGTKRITLVDIDPDARPHCELILELLNISTDGRQFVSYLCGSEVQKEWWKPHAFGKKVDWLPKLKQSLSANAFTLYEQSYARFISVPNSHQAKFEDSTIEFYDFNLTPLSFCWQFGKGNFAGEREFSALKETLNSIPIEYMESPLEALDYGQIYEKDDLPIYFLASNCESPLFTKNDKILKQVLNSARSQIHYFSWTRKMTIYPKINEDHDLFEKLTPWVGGKYLHILGDFTLAGLVEEKRITRFADLAALIKAQPYNEELLLCALPKNVPLDAKFLADLLVEIVPAFKRVIFICDDSASLLTALSSMDLHLSYFVNCIDWTSKRSIQVWDLRGAIVPPNRPKQIRELLA